MDTLFCIYTKMKETSDGISGGPVGLIINKRKEYAYLLFGSIETAKEMIKIMKLSNAQIIDSSLVGTKDYPVIKDTNKGRRGVLIDKEDLEFIKENGRLSNFKEKLIKLK